MEYLNSKIQPSFSGFYQAMVKKVNGEIVPEGDRHWACPRGDVFAMNAIARNPGLLNNGISITTEGNLIKAKLIFDIEKAAYDKAFSKFSHRVGRKLVQWGLLPDSQNYGNFGRTVNTPNMAGIRYEIDKLDWLDPKLMQYSYFKQDEFITAVKKALPDQTQWLDEFFKIG